MLQSFAKGVSPKQVGEQRFEFLLRGAFWYKGRYMNRVENFTS